MREMGRFSLSAPGKALRLAWRGHFITDFLLYLLVCAAIVWCILRGAMASGQNWQWGRVLDGFGVFTAEGFKAGPLLLGLLCTLKICLFGMVLAVCSGLAATSMRLFGGPGARFLATAYIQLIRNTPLLVHIFLTYFFLALYFDFSAFASAVFALGLFEGAYMAEIFRAGILAVPKEQVEAARSLGLGKGRAFAHIVLPQAVRHVMPPLVSQSISLVKDSSLAGAIALVELTQAGRLIIDAQFTVFETWTVVAATYLGLALLLSAISNRLRRRRG